MKKLVVKSYGNVDLSNPMEAVDYFIYLLKNDFRCVSLILWFSLDNYSISKYINEYLKKDNYLMKYLLAFHFAHSFYETFINENEFFIFNNYFFANGVSTDAEKKSKLNTIIRNAENLLKIISKEIGENDFKEIEVDEMKLMAKKFEGKFTNMMICSEYIDGKTIKIESHPYKLLLFCLGIILNKILKKIYIEFSAFVLKEPSIKKISQIEDVSKRNPYPRIFRDYKAFSLFEKLSESLCNDKRTLLADYSFVFRRLYKDNYIYRGIQESEFREFLFSNYQINLDKLKTLDNCKTIKKEQIYSSTI